MRMPAFAFLFSTLLVLPGVAATAATDMFAEHRRVYAEVNADLPNMTKEVFEIDDAAAEVPPEVTAWLRDGQPRKVQVLYPASDGMLLQEFYYKTGPDMPYLLFAYEAVTTESADGTTLGPQEHRYYFRDGRMIRWLDAGREPVTENSPEFHDRETSLLQDSSMVLSRLSESRAAQPGGTGDAPSGAIRETTGTFSGIEQGDYFHLLLTVDGEEHSFMILAADADLEALATDPDRYVGRTITIVWQTAVETIPEAGGPVEVTKALAVKGL